MPSFFPFRPGPGTPSSEARVWDALKSLSASWRVFHSVTWQVPKRNRVFDGEADFVLIHPKYGLIVLEVKGGELEVRDGVWYQRSSGGGEWGELSRSPHVQAKDAMYDLRSYLVERVEGLVDLRATRAVVLTGVSHPGELGLDTPSEMTIAKDELHDLPTAIEKLIAYGRLDADLNPDQMQGITGLLAPTIRLTTTIGTELNSANERLIELTHEQIRVLDALKAHRRALVVGGAGTGKTMLAVERAKRLSLDGAEVLLTCFNRPLGDHLAQSLHGVGSVTAKSFHALARWQMARAGLPVPDNPADGWWENDVPDLLAQAAVETGLAFDAIVVDEGQDFTASWFTSLQMLLRDPDDGPFYVFSDGHQSIYIDDWESPISGNPFHLTRNCRNTNQIAEKVAAVIRETPADLGTDGLAPEFIVAPDDHAMLTRIDDMVGHMLTNEQVEPGQVTVLSDSKGLVTKLQQGTLGGAVVGGVGSMGVVAETIHRFKGLENDVVIVALHRVGTDRQRRLAYIGMSRARGLLIVLGPKDVKKAIGW